MNKNNRVGRKAVRTLLLRSAIHAETLRQNHLKEHRWTVIGCLAIITALVIGGMLYREKELEWQVTALEASQVRQVKIASSKLIKEVATKEAELKALRQVAEATKSSKPNVIYIDRQTTKGKALDAVVQKWGAEHLEAFTNLISHESGFNALAMNPTSGACGLFQAVPCSKMGCELPDIDCQIKWGLNYIAQRYQTPSKAWAFWKSRVPVNGKDLGNWY